MINFFRFSDNLHEICIRDLSIYYSFKMPVAYRINGELKIRKYISKRHFEIIVAGHEHVTVEKDVFDFNLRYIFKSTIYNLAEDFTKERMGIPQKDKHEPIYIGKMQAVNLDKLEQH